MTTSRLTPEIITLDSGLNLQTAKILAPQGSVLDCLNYEQVDFQGQKRIDGYVRYDGSLGSYQTGLYVLYLQGEARNEATPGGIRYNNGRPFAITVGFSNTSETLAILDHNFLPQVGDEWGNMVITDVIKLADEVDADEQYSTILSANSTLRQRVTSLPGPIAGLHWFNDRLYAVASVQRLVLGPEHGFMINDTYEGHPVLAVDETTVTIGDTTVYPDSVTSEIASLFQSRSEQQALDELGDATLYGWEFVHQGWNVPFEEGLSLYGSLPARNLNLEGVGTQGPTSISGSNGRPLFVTQKVQISGAPTQVNGWKASDTPTSYNVSASYIADADTTFLYADAYVSWEGDSSEVEVSGLGDLVLTENSPTASVVVEV